jgi:tRNA modification GTPase
MNPTLRDTTAWGTDGGNPGASSAPTDATWELLTPPGVGAIAVLRLRGADADRIARASLRTKRGDPIEPPAAGRIVRAQVVDGDEVLDDALVASSHDPDGQAAFDVCCHGGPRIVQRIAAQWTRLGARPPYPPAGGATHPSAGPLTPTRMSLIEEECLAAWQRARTERAVRFVARQRAVLPRFAEEVAELWSRAPSAVPAGRREAHGLLSAALVRGRVAGRWIDGARVVLLGQPNAGKSTLCNRLAGRTVSVVTDRPGTTRDWVSCELDLLGLAVELIDTAGIRDGLEALEACAVARGLERAATADVRVVVFDASAPPPPDVPRRLAALTGEEQKTLLVMSKIDRMSGAQARAWSDVLQTPHVLDRPGERFEVPLLADRRAVHGVSVSGATGAGLDHLGTALLATLGLTAVEDGDALPALFTPRLRGAVEGLLAAGDESRDDGGSVIRTRLL